MRPSSHHARVRLLFVVTLSLLASTIAEADALPKPVADQLVFLGLRPLKVEHGAGDRHRLAEAQAVGAVAQHALEQVSGQPPFGHEDLKRLFGRRYVARWFKCDGDPGCMIKVFPSLGRLGYKVAVTGDYFVDAKSYKFRLLSFTVADAKIVKEITFELAASNIKSVARWQEALAPLVSVANGKIRLVADLVDSACTIDGEPCHFDPPGDLLSVAPGEHTIELTKAGYQPEKVTVPVASESEQEVTIRLKPVAKEHAPEPQGGIVMPAGGARRSPTLAAIRTDKPPNIDGRLDDPSWAKAWLETNFAQHFPNEGKPPTERTELRVLYDDSAVYVAIRCFDLHPDEIVARLTRRDRDIDGDKVTVDISSKNDKASAYHFQVNAAGVQVDGLRFNDTDYNNDWDGRWYSATTRDAQGWTTELKIPLVTLRYSGSVSSFGFQVRRYLGRSEEIDEWAYIPRTAKGEVSYYGTLDSLAGLNSERLFQILAYASSRLTLRNRQGAFDGHTMGASIGGDLKLGITTALTLDATVNPDFGTVEADQVVLNLTTVETRFPEKRPFFIEGADLFTTPLNLFYSRRVGATPPAPSLGPSAHLVAPVPDGGIYSAVKLTGPIAKRLSIGVVDVVTARENALVDRGTGGADEKLLVEPLTNFGVLRLRQDFGTNSSLGLLATSVNRFEPADAAAPQPMDLCPVPYSTTFATLVPPSPRNGRCTNDAYTGGLDTVLRTENGEWGASAQVVGSRIENGPTRRIPDGTQIGSGSTGVGLVAEAGRYGGETWLYRVAYGFSTPQLQINDAGFQDQANFHEFVGSLTMRTTTPSKYLLGASLELFVDHKREWSFQDNVDFNGQIRPTLELSNFWTVSAGIMPYFPKYVDHRETQDGARTERNAGFFGVVEVKSDPKKLFVMDVSAAALHVYGGQKIWEVSSTLSLRPIPALELDLIPHFIMTYGGARSVDTEPNMDGSRTYYFSDLDAKELDLTLRGTYTFRRNLTLQAYLQPFVDSGHYAKAVASTASGQTPLLSLDSFTRATLPAGVMPDFRDGTINVNLFLRWEYLPLSALWIVFTRSQQQTPYATSEGPARIRFDQFAHGPATDVFLLKLSYLW